MLGENNEYETLFYDFRWTEIRGVLTPGMRAEIENYISTSGRPLFGISEAVLFVAQRKIKDTPFVPPLDVPTGTKAPSAVLANRYWPVFKPKSGIHAFRRKLKRLIILMLIRQ
jgi:hypothetical protein